LPPEQVCEYIANKCGGARLVLDGFAGVGAMSIKIAYVNSSAKVISVDYNSKKLKFLHNNAKIYEVDKRI
jgi:tRNA G37 N-methylase Trm5